MKKSIHLPSPAMIVAVVALLVASTGTSYAALKLKRNSVGALQIKRGAVNSTKVRDRTLLTKDFKAGQLPRGLPGRQGLSGSVGPAGPQGPQGLQGLKGQPGSARAFMTLKEDGTVVPGAARNAETVVVSHPDVGRYCVSGVSFAPTSAVVSALARGTSASVMTSTVLPGLAGICEAKDQAVVQVFESSTGDFANDPFTLWLDG